MARIVVDRGRQVYQIPRDVDPRGGTIMYYEYDLDCSCTLRVTEQFMRNTQFLSVERVAEAHVCGVETFMVHTEAARRFREREKMLRTWGTVNPPWQQQEIINRFYNPVEMGRRRSPAEVEWAMRTAPQPQVAPEEQVRRAITETQQAAATLADPERHLPVGFKPGPAVETPAKKEPDLKPKDRFELIELD